MLQGVVNDPTSRRMGGVAGHAGLFSTADDLSIFAQNLLDLLAGQAEQISAEPLDRREDDYSAESCDRLSLFAA